MATALRRLLAALFAVGLTTGAVIASGSAAAAADEVVRVYEGQWGANSYTYTARCTGDTCVLSTAKPPGVLADFLTKPLTVTGGSARATRPDDCGKDDKGGGFSNERTFTLALTATRLTATVVEKSGDRRRGTMHCWSRGGTDTIRAVVATPAAATQQPAGATPQPAVPTTLPVAPGVGQSQAVSAPLAVDSDVTSSRTTSQLSSGAPDAPSVLGGLRTSADIDARESLLAALVTIVLVLLIVFPTTLLNSAAEQGSDRFSTWWRRHRTGATAEAPAEPSAGAPADVTKARQRSRWSWAASGVLAAGVMSSFVDPQFGLNPGSLRVVLSIVVGFAVDVVLGWLVVVWLVRRTLPQATASYAFQPLSLLLVAAAVVFTRLTGFEPGIIFGLVAGVGFTALVGRAAEGRAALAPLAYGATVALLAWAGYQLVDDATGTVGVFVAETLSATAVTGLAALPMALFPVAGLPGASVFAWSRRIWASCYGFGLFAFFIVLMPTPIAWDEVAWSLKGWVLVYLVYLAVALTAWWAVRRTRRESATDLPPVPGHDAGDLGGVLGVVPD